MKIISGGQISGSPRVAGDSSLDERDRREERITRAWLCLPFFQPLHKVGDLFLRVVRAFGNDGLMSAVFL